MGTMVQGDGTGDFPLLHEGLQALKHLEGAAGHTSGARADEHLLALAAQKAGAALPQGNELFAVTDPFHSAPPLSDGQ